MKEQIIGKTVYLRKLQKSDLNRTWEWLHTPEINNKIGVKIPFSKDKQLIWFNKLVETKDKYIFAICNISNNNHIGNVSLDMIDFRHMNARLSIFIAENNHRGKGLGSEALQLLENFAFNNLKLHKIWCKTDAGDPKVFNFYKKKGFKQEGTLKEHELKQNKYIDKIIFAKINSQ